ncbi:hypothetical protein DAPPUDRAFT_303656 [Daphnia pulex]|uniref:Uncharacterized protein n=1 Tax=Daphnia pulex TaxID=6669 RepID=E9GHK4_DAPPU|nr:hypothetical protein DAPPUDRAFT_303656 [Daphnia pulex]|eukprot:EFX81041.1 hypothetical protein DAPPUDRAFT_303656 [Daphnia pulex]
MKYIVAVLLALTSAVSAWRYPFYDPSSSRHGYPLLPFYDQDFPAPWPYQGPYYPEDFPEFRVFPCSPRPFPYYASSVADREFEHENQMKFRDDIDNDESFDTADDDLPDDRLIHFQTNTPYRRFNNFIRTLDNLRSAFRARRRWNFKIRRNKNGLVFETIQEPAVEEENHQANSYDYYYVNN